MMRLPDNLVVIRGAGEMASGVAYRLHQAGVPVAMLELPAPLVVRRTVSFAEAVPLGRWTVEDVTAVRVDAPEAAAAALKGREVPVAVDPEMRLLPALRPLALVDATVGKRNPGTRITDAPIVITLGPGYTAGVDCHAVIETNRGHQLGRVLYRGSAAPDTGIPAPVQGAGAPRVLRAPVGGTFTALAEIGDVVESGQVVGEVAPPEGPARAVAAGIPGVLRGLLRSGVSVPAGLKVGDVDPTGERERCHTISDKALAIGGGVLEALLHLSGRPAPDSEMPDRYRFCPRCAHPLSLAPVAYDGNRIRPACGHCGFVYFADPKVAAGTILVLDGGVLLTRRAIEPAFGRWVFPGGYVDRGEPVDQAAVRETREETGLEVVLDDLLGVYSFPGNPVVVVVYRARVTGGALTLNPECSEARAFAPHEIPWDNLAFDTTAAALRDWLTATRPGD